MSQREPQREHSNDGNYRNSDVNQCGITGREKILCTALRCSQHRTQEANSHTHTGLCSDRVMLLAFWHT